MLCRDGAVGSGVLAIETDEVVDAQVVDIGVIGNALTREILAEIGAVSTYSKSQLQKRQVVLQVKFFGYAALFQQLFNMG